MTTPPPEEAAEEEATETRGRAAPDGTPDAGTGTDAEGEAEGDAEAGGDDVRRQPPSRRVITVVGVVLAVMVVMNWVGDAMTTTWSDTHPAWLIALNSRNRILALTTNQLDAWSYYGIATVRLLSSDPLFYLLGYWYGDSAIVWMEKRTQTWGQMLRQAEGWFGRAAYPLVFLLPNNPICLLAGAAGMPLKAFVALNVSGTIFRLYVIRRVGETFEAPLDDILGFFGEYRLPLFILSVVLLVVTIALEAKGGETEVAAMANLDDELDAERPGRNADTGDGDGDAPADR